MAKYNKTGARSTKTINKAGGVAYSETPELALASLVLTSFLKDQFYRKEEDTINEVKVLLNQLKDKKFAAQTAIYARTKFGMRSISHVLGAEIAHIVKGADWTRSFFDKVVYRPDDMLETVSYYLKNYGTPIPNSMKKGFAKAFGKFDEYQLAKYKAEGSELALVDLVNLVHPHPTEKNRLALKKLVEGKLKNKKTWEAKLSAAGKKEDEEDVIVEKAKAWGSLIKDGKLGYFALLKNLRNIIEQAPASLPAALKQLTDEDAIKKSLVLPFRFTTAFAELEKIPGAMSRRAMASINDALDISCQNVPKFKGETLVVLDDSGSMGYGGLDSKNPFALGSLFAAVLVKSNNCDFMMFSDEARYINLNAKDSVTSLIEKMSTYRTGNGTNFNTPFEKATQKYDRIIILSDMQGWMSASDGYYSIGGAPTASFNAYKKKFDANPRIYSFDLQGYGSLQFPQPNVYAIAGFSEKVFDLMNMMDEDRNAMVNEIKKVII